MSSYTVIRETTKKLRSILWTAFQANANFSVITSDQSIVFENPAETAKDRSSNRLSLWLYHINENGHSKNQPIETDGKVPPLALNLYYLMTPFARGGENDHILMGKLLEVFYDNAIVELRDPSEGVAEKLHIALVQMTLEELSQIWDALREPYRLSVCYHVRVVHIDSTRTTQGTRVTERAANYTDGSTVEEEALA